MNEISCDVIRDLLPSYIDGLTSEATNRLVEEHLKTCENCRAVYEAMKNPEGAAAGTPEEQKEIDFLKKNKRKNRMTVIFSILGALALLVLILLLRVFVIGNKDFRAWVPMPLTVEGKELKLSAVPTDSASAIAALSFTEEDGVVTVKARSVLVSPLFRGRRDGAYTAQETIREVRSGDRILWSEGATVSAQASELFAAKHDYIGDMSANQKTARALNLSGYLGPYTNELETAEEPYGWKILLQTPVTPDKLTQKERDMDAFGQILISLIGNLDHVTFVYTADGKETSRTVTAADATAFFGEDIKNCGRDVRALDRLIDKTGLQLYADTREAGEEEEDAVWLQLFNMTDTEFKTFGVNFYRDGKFCSSMGMMNADESLIKNGDSFWFDAAPINFGLDNAGFREAGTALEIELEAEAADGRQIRIPERIRIIPVPNAVLRLQLTGNAEEGYTVIQ